MLHPTLDPFPGIVHALKKHKVQSISATAMDSTVRCIRVGTRLESGPELTGCCNLVDCLHMHVLTSL